MSTRTRESGPPGKEKRGTSPSSHTTSTGARRSPVPSKTTSLDSSRNIPGYLKPTASSINDVSKAKKPAPTLPDTANKPNLARRRSFDKPPSPSRTQKSPVSPSPTLRSSSFSGKIATDSSASKPGAARRRSFDKPPSPSRTQKSPVSPNPAPRTSSLPGKVGAAQKGASERNVKEGGKQHTLYARPVSTTVKKSSGLAKKNEPVSGASRKAAPHRKVERRNVHDIPEPEPEHEPRVDDQDESFIVEEHTVLVEDYIDKESEDSLLQDQEVPNIIEKSEGESEDQDAEVLAIESPVIVEQNDATIVMVESPTVAESQDDKAVIVEYSAVIETQDASPSVEIEEIEHEQAEEIISQQEETEEDNVNEVNHSDIDESVADNTNQEADDADEQEEQQEDNDKMEEIGLVSKEEEADSGNESHEAMENEVQEVVAEEETNEAEDGNPRVAHGKKDLALSNDVIEETRNKLIEQRKNKVRALAGAFETVISLQDK